MTARPWAIGPADIHRLSEAGLSRTSIVLVIGLVSLFNYLTRVADGTGVEAITEPSFPGSSIAASRMQSPGLDRKSGRPSISRSSSCLNYLPYMRLGSAGAST